MGNEAWWPIGLTSSTFEDVVADARFPTQWGFIDCWDYTVVEDTQWWKDVLQAGQPWGEWPQSIETITLLKHDSSGVHYAIDDKYRVHVSPLLHTAVLSTLARYVPWEQALTNVGVLLPVSGILLHDSDAVLVYPMYTEEQDNSFVDIRNFIQRMSSTHEALAEFATPNTERTWNADLNSLEEKMKTSTLWRAPHSADTQGIPNIRLETHSKVMRKGRDFLLALPHDLTHSLLVKSDRIPSLALLMMTEFKWEYTQGVSGKDQEVIFDTWSSIVPKKWSSQKALSTANGGAWIWRYHACLLQLAHAIAFKDTMLEMYCRGWLKNVSRIQAKLSTRQMIKIWIWVAVALWVFAYFGWKLEVFTPLIAVALSLVGVGLTGLSRWLFQRQIIPPYETS
ncbi:MAG: hypothetical protein O2866_03465 [archaeon]|nr:hypothetical protein [archaeon]MDA1167922.1 hypothetical protein [archaeon]